VVGIERGLWLVELQVWFWAGSGIGRIGEGWIVSGGRWAMGDGRWAMGGSC
jgi:hypothetical protein